MDSACWVGFCCRHSPVYDMNVRIFLSLCDGMHVCTDYTLVYILVRKSFGGTELRGKNPLYQKNSLQRRFKPTMLHHAGQQSQHCQLSYSSPKAIFGMMTVTTDEQFHPSINGLAFHSRPQGQKLFCQLSHKVLGLTVACCRDLLVL